MNIDMSTISKNVVIVVIIELIVIVEVGRE